MRFKSFEQEWEYSTIGKCSISLEYGMNAAAIKYDGKHKYIRITDIDEETSAFIPNPLSSPDCEFEQKYLVKENDILFARTGASVGKSYLYNPNDGELYFAGFLIRARIKPEYNGTFIYYQTKSKKYNRWVKLTSMRSGQPGINSQEYSGYPIAITGKVEQDKIADFFQMLDNRISVQNKIISKYETLIKGLKNQLYSRKARFTSHNKIPFSKWEKKQLSEILSISTEKNGSQYSKEKVLSVSDEYGVVNQIKFQGKSFAGQDISNYKVVKSGQIIYTRSPLAAKPFGIIKIVGNETGIVSPLYIVNTVNNGYDALFIFYLFDTPQSTNNYLKPLVRVGAKHTMNISNDEWLSGTVIIPCLEEQKMIAEVLQSIDEKISFEKKVLEKLKEQKTYLLSKMFI